jgi:hypothetical protein
LAIDGMQPIPRMFRRGWRSRRLGDRCRTLHAQEKHMKWLTGIALIFASVVSAEAYTCADVRALSAEQQAYYIKVFNITPAQQDRIRQACYGGRGRHVNVANEERSHTSRNERDARVTP